MNKYIGFDIDSKKIVACVVESGKKDIYQTFGPSIESMRRFLIKHKQSDHRVELAFEISGQAGFIYDSLIDCVDDIEDEGGKSIKDDLDISYRKEERPDRRSQDGGTFKYWRNTLSVYAHQGSSAMAGNYIAS